MSPLRILQLQRILFLSLLSHLFYYHGKLSVDDSVNVPFPFPRLSISKPRGLLEVLPGLTIKKTGSACIT
jgi:hypothetical protein